MTLVKALVTLDQKKIVTKRINGAHLKLYLRPHSSPHKSTPPTSPHQSTLPASERVSGAHLKPYNSEVVDKGNVDKRSELNHKARNKQLYSPHLLHLWWTGACELFYKAEEDDEELEVSSHSFHI